MSAEVDVASGGEGEDEVYVSVMVGVEAAVHGVQGFSAEWKDAIVREMGELYREMIADMRFACRGFLSVPQAKARPAEDAAMAKVLHEYALRVKRRNEELKAGMGKEGLSREERLRMGVLFSVYDTFFIHAAFVPALLLEEREALRGGYREALAAARGGERVIPLFGGGRRGARGEGEGGVQLSERQ